MLMLVFTLALINFTLYFFYSSTETLNRPILLAEKCKEIVGNFLGLKVYSLQAQHADLLEKQSLMLLCIVSLHAELFIIALCICNSHIRIQVSKTMLREALQIGNSFSPSVSFFVSFSNLTEDSRQLKLLPCVILVKLLKLPIENTSTRNFAKFSTYATQFENDYFEFRNSHVLISSKVFRSSQQFPCNTNATFFLFQHTCSFVFSQTFLHCQGLDCRLLLPMYEFHVALARLANCISL